MVSGLRRLWLDDSGLISAEAALMIAVLAVGSLGAVVGLAERAGDALHHMGSQYSEVGRDVVVNPPG
jgi:Flp pilus assembly pilin Flp